MFYDRMRSDPCGCRYDVRSGLYTYYCPVHLVKEAIYDLEEVLVELEDEQPDPKVMKAIRRIIGQLRGIQAKLEEER